MELVWNGFVRIRIRLGLSLNIFVRVISSPREIYSFAGSRMGLHVCFRVSQILFINLSFVINAPIR